MHPPPEVHAFEQLLQSSSDPAPIFHKNSPITAARVPSRLDVMGGIADYSGSNVCQTLLAPGTLAAVQSRTDSLIHIRTLQLAAAAIPAGTYISLEQLAPTNDYPAVRNFFKQNALASWAAYPAGSLFALLKEQSLDHSTGFNILLLSTIPMNVGIASSAAIELATLFALNAHLNLNLPPLRLAQLGQLAENRIVGAPCGIMDQIAIAAGNPAKLTHILCRPAGSGQILGEIGIPPGVAFVGLNTNIRHSIAANPYAHVRIGAFIGKKIINTLRTGSGMPAIAHLTELTPAQFLRDYLPHLPDTLTGQAFLDQYQTHEDPVTTIDPATTYRIAGPTRHPIVENARVLQFIAALQSNDLLTAGQQMYSAHDSYKNNCHLSTPEIDALIDVLKSLPSTSGIYGAKITGGGTGGTLALLATPDALTHYLPSILADFHRRTATLPLLIEGSSPNVPSSLIRRYTRTPQGWQTHP